MMSISTNEKNYSAQKILPIKPVQQHFYFLGEETLYNASCMLIATLSLLLLYCMVTLF